MPHLFLLVRHFARQRQLCRLADARGYACTSSSLAAKQGVARLGEHFVVKDQPWPFQIDVPRLTASLPSEGE